MKQILVGKRGITHALRSKRIFTLPRFSPRINCLPGYSSNGWFRRASSSWASRSVGESAQVEGRGWLWRRWCANRRSDENWLSSVSLPQRCCTIKLRSMCTKILVFCSMHYWSIWFIWVIHRLCLCLSTNRCTYCSTARCDHSTDSIKSMNNIIALFVRFMLWNWKEANVYSVPSLLLFASS